MSLSGPVRMYDMEVEGDMAVKPILVDTSHLRSSLWLFHTWRMHPTSEDPPGK